MLNKVCFAIDNPHDVHTVAKFMRYMDTKRVMGELTGSLIQCVGFWEGELEPSYIMNVVDYEKFVVPMNFTDNQDCVMYIPGDTRQSCTMKFRDEEQIYSLGPLKRVKHEEVHKYFSYTYLLATKTYWVTTTSQNWETL